VWQLRGMENNNLEEDRTTFRWANTMSRARKRQGEVRIKT